ncbi:hypothetical protein SL003B_4001 [Polymorphum gilvum SL003B-26A1]|uniref:Uncharacterized protein n=1 Tax=Polymorphum gilvum (strain LMG 25793 / CGMCC 1.9160 / SL003B-26A1) TaxID=991905 RepID=F2J657_POLGS|nr:hypothetical protein SL003B_4001 [Polymorphum gilvum SL003B-26A1]
MACRRTLTAQIQEVEHELAMRRRVYPGLVSQRRLREGEATEHWNACSTLCAGWPATGTGSRRRSRRETEGFDMSIHGHDPGAARAATASTEGPDEARPDRLRWWDR